MDADLRVTTQGKQEILFKPEKMVKRKLSRWRLRGCPRCGGDLKLEHGQFLEYVCLACGCRHDLRQPAFQEVKR